MSNDDSSSKKRKRSGKKSGKIFFDEEVVPKGSADTKRKTEGEFQNEVSNNSGLTQTTNKNKRKKNAHNQESTINKKSSSDVNSENKDEKHKESFKKQKRKKKSEERKEDETLTQEEESNGFSKSEQSELDPANPTIEKEESKRAMKRKKHQQLLRQKKLKVDLVLQEKALNYLSRWKHNRDEWKFEKLRQIWLQQNMFDSDQVPDRFWDTLLNYFSNAKGKIRQTIIDDALRIIESGNDNADKNEKTENISEEIEDDESENNLTKVHRAKIIIQSLQE